ncbi:MAG: tetratricopeptide repeat protein, partial [Nostocaceae cyanobacterium]|nr:tetratricopeptide repeat protein [Nostocaceae cyanobacterium]
MESQEPQERQTGILFCEWEYENLYHALEICLQNQQSISIYFCLDKYFLLINDNQSNLQLAEKVCLAVDNYPPAFLESQLGYQVPSAINRLGNCYLEAKEYHKARECYQQNLEITPKLVGEEERQKQLWMSVDYHQLGRVAQELREFSEARRNYQLALEISLEYGARYDSASTYH